MHHTIIQILGKYAPITLCVT